MNALRKLLKDPVVTTRTCFRHICVIDTRLRVVFRQDMVRRVAVGTHGGHHQPALQKPLSVNALSVMLNDVVLRSRIADRRLLSFAMALCAELRNIDRECRRLLIASIPGPVVAVAIGACRRIRVAAIDQLSVRAGRID